MAKVTVPDKGLTHDDPDEIKKYLNSIGLGYECWPTTNVSSKASDIEILEAYSSEIETLKKAGSYVTADVINVTPETPGLDAMLDKFNKEHWHDEDEVRFIVKGHGLFHLAPTDGDVVSIEMEAGDLICIPRGTHHWFDLCGDRTIRAIRLFQDVAGWTPHYTESGIDADYQPSCLGLSYFPASPY